MQKKVLITGVSGFAGSYLAEYFLKRKDYDIYGTYLSEESLFVIAEIKNRIQLEKIDLIQKDKVFKLIGLIKPDFIFHLAALSSPGDSFKDPEGTIINNIIAQLNLLEAVKRENLIETHILIISSGDIYGVVSKKDLPINEEANLMPTSPYSVSKITQDYLGLQYFLSYKLKIIRVRPFNHIGPRQSPNFVLSSFAKKIAEIEKDKRKPILEVGNLEARRDFTDVRDMVFAYSLILEKGIPGDVYNIGSGVSYKIEDILKKLVSLSKNKIEIKIDNSLFRPSDVPELLCDNRKFKKITGWEPIIPIEKTIKDTLDYWRSIV